MIAEWAGNPSYIGGSLVLFFAIACLICWSCRNEAPSFWRGVNVIIIFVGGFSLLSLTFESYRDVSQWRLTVLSGYAIGAGIALEIEVNGLKVSGCSPRTRTDLSPPKFDEIVAQQKAICVWAKQAADQIDSLNFRLVPDVKLFVKSRFPEVTFEPLVKDYESLLTTLNDYQNIQREHHEIKSATQHDSPIRRFIAIFAPFLLSFALALSLAKALFQPNPS